MNIIRKTQKAFQNFPFFWVFVGLFVVYFITMLLIGGYLGAKYGTAESHSKFTDSDWDYMISETERRFGNGKKFILYEKESKPITKRYYSSCYLVGGL